MVEGSGPENKVPFSCNTYTNRKFEPEGVHYLYRELFEVR